MRQLRTSAALVSLGLFTWVLLTYRPRGLPMGREPSPQLVGSFLIPVVLLAWGFLRERPWATWSGAALGLAVFPWAFVLSVTPSMGAPITRQVVALVASVLLLLSTLSAGRRKAVVRSSSSSQWIRWSLILNLASALNLCFFVVAYEFGATWQSALLGGVLGGLLLGVALLSRQKTVGVLLLAGAAASFIPAAVLFLNAEARSLGEAGLFVVLFGPGVIAAIGTLLVFGKPLLRMFGDAD